MPKKKTTTSEHAHFQRIWELSKHSPFKEKLRTADVRLEADNVSCGDWLEFSFTLKGDTIVKARFQHTGCSVSSVAASVFCEYAEGKTLSHIKKLPAEKLLELFGAPVSSGRLKCALLPMDALR